MPSPAASYIYDLEERRNVFINRHWLTACGYTPEEAGAMGDQVCVRVFHADDLPRMAAHLDGWRRAGEGEMRSIEYRVRTKAGAWRWLLSRETDFTRDAEGRVTQILGIAHDVTDRKLADEALRAGRHLLSEAQRIARIGSWSWDLATNAVTWTEETYRLYGVSAVDFVPDGQRFMALIHSDDRDSMQRWIEACVAGELPPDLEFRAVHPSGEVRVLSGRGDLDRDADGHPLRMVGTVQDVTERRRAEDALREARDRLRSLSARLVTVQEDERRSLARELHDHLGQLLTGLKLSIEMARRLPGDRRQAALDEAARLAGEVLGEVRRLSVDLRPSVLDDLGLLAALVWHAERFTSQTGVRVALSHAGLDRRLPTLVETTAFRIAQESLSNVARHAGVDEASLFIACAEGLRMEVSDRGSGFDVPEALGRRASAGLSGMQERAALAGGRLSIETSPGAGCRIVLDLPLEATA